MANKSNMKSHSELQARQRRSHFQETFMKFGVAYVGEMEERFRMRILIIEDKQEMSKHLKKGLDAPLLIGSSNLR
jgi:hypothetical protein